MPHVSSKKLKGEYLNNLYAKFSEAIERSAKKSVLKFFLNDFLTKTEKIMLAKRFAVIYLLYKGLPVVYIAEALHMSPATVQRMSLKFEIGKYSAVLKTIERDNQIWNILEKILRAGLSPRVGRGRWKFLYN